MSNCDFVTFPFGILGQVWYLIVLIPDLGSLSYLRVRVNAIRLQLCLLQVFLAVFVFLIWSAKGQQQGCPAKNPTGDPNKACTCTGGIMDCSGPDRALTVIPQFMKVSPPVITELRLQDNFIDTIPNGAFKNLTGLTKLLLQFNNISVIGDNAFDGLDASLLELNLGSNELTTLPISIAQMDNLETLDVTHNKIDEHNFNEYVMYSIGNTLTKFEFGSEAVRDWPSTLRHLQALQYLNVTGGSFFTLPPNAFHGFEGTLQTLSMQNTELIAVPLALSRLRYLDRLFFDHNHQIGDSGILIPSFGGANLLSHLTFISLIDDNLRVFPSLLRFLTNVETLILDSNRLAFVSDSSVNVAVGTKISTLSLRNCSLSRVPGALSKLTNITSLDLSENEIHSFENSDFDGMGFLQKLIIMHNPLEYIANETFKDLVNLKELNLENTEIKTMPEAIRFLKRLETLKVPIDRLECTCNIVWLKHFMEACNTGLRIAGTCETIKYHVDEYLKTFIPLCPNYKATSASCV